MKSLEQIQNEVGQWSQANFGDNISKVTGLPMFSQNALTGLVEEVGELNHATICHHQGRRGYDPTTEAGEAKYVADRNDALADILIFLCDFAYREGVSLLQLVNKAWEETVSKRNMQNWEQHSHDKSPATQVVLMEGFDEANKTPPPFPLADDLKRMKDMGCRVAEYPEVGVVSDPDASQDYAQNGQGFAEPVIIRDSQIVSDTKLPPEADATFGDGIRKRPEEETKRKPLTSSYNRYCSICKTNLIHRMNTSGYCPQCAADEAAKKANAERHARGEFTLKEQFELEQEKARKGQQNADG